MDFSAGNRSNWDPDQDIRKSLIWQYCGNNLGIWRCPADKSYVTVSGQRTPRLRSMAINAYVGGFAGTAGSAPPAPSAASSSGATRWWEWRPFSASMLR